MTLRNILCTVALLGAVGTVNTVEAKKNKGDEGILIEITVLDADTKEPIPTAVLSILWLLNHQR